MKAVLNRFGSIKLTLVVLLLLACIAAFGTFLPQGGDVEAWEKLGDGYRVEVRVVIWENDDVVKIPTSSLFRNGDEWAVFALDSGRARLRPVELGRRNGLEAQVVSGLEEGQEVVVHPSDTLEDGARVAPRPS